MPLRRFRFAQVGLFHTIISVPAVAKPLRTALPAPALLSIYHGEHILVATRPVVCSLRSDRCLGWLRFADNQPISHYDMFYILAKESAQWLIILNMLLV